MKGGEEGREVGVNCGVGACAARVARTEARSGVW